MALADNLFFCDTAIQDKETGKNSYIGLFERVFTEQFPVVIRCNFILRLRFDEAQPKEEFKLEFCSPAGERKTLLEFARQEIGDNRRAYTHFQLGLEFNQTGDYQMQVFQKDQESWNLIGSEDLGCNLVS